MVEDKRLDILLGGRRLLLFLVLILGIIAVVAWGLTVASGFLTSLNRRADFAEIASLQQSLREGSAKGQPIGIMLATNHYSRISYTLSSDEECVQLFDSNGYALPVVLRTPAWTLDFVETKVDK